MKWNETKTIKSLVWLGWGRPQKSKQQQGSGSRTAKKPTVKQNRNMEWIRRSNRENSSTHLSNLFEILYYIPNTRMYARKPQFCEPYGVSAANDIIHAPTCEWRNNLEWKKLFKERKKKKNTTKSIFFLLLCPVYLNRLSQCFISSIVNFQNETVQFNRKKAATNRPNVLKWIWKQWVRARIRESSPVARFILCRTDTQIYTHMPFIQLHYENHEIISLIFSLCAAFRPTEWDRDSDSIGNRFTFLAV